MNPATGTFITQDTYAGTIFDLTSLHKYLYANANPVMNVDPSGYSPNTGTQVTDIATVIVFIHPAVYIYGARVQHDAQVMTIGHKIIQMLRGIQPYLSVGIMIYGDQIVSAVEMLLTGIKNSLSTNTAIRDTALEFADASLNGDPPSSKNKTRDKQYKDYYVYFGYRDGEIVYVGITNNVARRRLEHGGRFDFIDQINPEPLKKIEAKGVEQVLIERNKKPIGKFENKINSISPYSPRYSSAYKFGEQYLERNTKYLLLREAGKVN